MQEVWSVCGGEVRSVCGGGGEGSVRVGGGGSCHGPYSHNCNPGVSMWSIVYTGHNVQLTVSKSQITVKSQCKMFINVGQTFKLNKLKGVRSQNFDLLSQL